MDAIVQCRGMFYKFGYSGKNYVERLNLKKKDLKRCEKCQRIWKNNKGVYFYCYFLDLFI